MKEIKKKFILFDFDGVILDSFDTALGVAQMICPHVTDESHRKRFEGNINDWANFKDEHTDKCRHDINFFDEYLPKIRSEVKIFYGIKEVIENLSKDYILIVISSTISAPIFEILEKFGLAKHFTEIMGNDVHKSKVEKIKMVFDKYKTKAEDCVFVTDTLGDIKEANETGVKSIAVTWGFHSKETLLKGEPFLVINEPSELINVVSSYFKG
jgi:phosphoglycolate phosphatase